MHEIKMSVYYAVSLLGFENPALFQMAPLDQQQQVADRSVLSQRLDMPQVDLPPEETSLSLTQLVPELDLIGEKSKDKKDDSDEEEVRRNTFFCNTKVRKKITSTFHCHHVVYFSKHSKEMWCFNLFK